MDALATLKASVAVTLRPEETDDLVRLERNYFRWSAWTRHHWPADVVRKGLRLYGFDKSQRKLCVLFKVTRGGAFTYRSRKELESQIHQVTGWRPGFDDRYGRRVPIPRAGQTS
jgi:hypothetical protein